MLAVNSLTRVWNSIYIVYETCYNDRSLQLAGEVKAIVILGKSLGRDIL